LSFIDHVVRHEAEHFSASPAGSLGGKQGLEHIPGIVYRRDGQVVKSAAFNEEFARAKQGEGFI